MQLNLKQKPLSVKYQKGLRTACVLLLLAEQSLHCRRHLVERRRVGARQHGRPVGRRYKLQTLADRNCRRWLTEAAQCSAVQASAVQCASALSHIYLFLVLWRLLLPGNCKVLVHSMI